MKNLKEEFLKGIEEEIEKLADARELNLSLAREYEEVSVESYELISDSEDRNFIQNCRYLWNICIDRGCTEDELENIFPEGV